MHEHRTHREVKNPKMSARALADYMAASETARRTIVRDCKYQSRARVIQHDEAKLAVSKFIRAGGTDLAPLNEEVRRLRERLADTDFDRDLFDHNADYIERFAEMSSTFELPKAERSAPGAVPPIEINGVQVGVELHFRLRRLTRTNKVRIGGGMLRYAKRKSLSADIAAWQSAFLFGYLGAQKTDEAAEPEHDLCVTIDAWTGACHGAPSDAVRRYQNMKAACATIAERWPKVEPPAGAIL